MQGKGRKNVSVEGASSDRSVRKAVLREAKRGARNWMREDSRRREKPLARGQQEATVSLVPSVEHRR